MEKETIKSSFIVAFGTILILISAFFFVKYHGKQAEVKPPVHQSNIPHLDSLGQGYVGVYKVYTEVVTEELREPATNVVLIVVNATMTSNKIAREYLYDIKSVKAIRARPNQVAEVVTNSFIPPVYGVYEVCEKAGKGKFLRLNPEYIVPHVDTDLLKAP